MLKSGECKCVFAGLIGAEIHILLEKLQNIVELLELAVLEAAILFYLYLHNTHARDVIVFKIVPSSCLDSVKMETFSKLPLWDPFSKVCVYGPAKRSFHVN